MGPSWFMRNLTVNPSQCSFVRHSTCMKQLTTACFIIVLKEHDSIFKVHPMYTLDLYLVYNSKYKHDSRQLFCVLDCSTHKLLYYLNQ